MGVNKKRETTRGPKKPGTWRLYLIAIIVSVVLFTAGLYSGLSVNSLQEKKQEQERAFLVEYVNRLDSNLKNYQLQEQFIRSLNQSAACAFSQTYFANTIDTLTYYWNILPTRLEEYERDHAPSKEYSDLKREYTTLSVRAWLTARETHERCNTDTVPVLYFYTASCTQCVAQGEALDSARLHARALNKTVVVFTIDGNSDEPAISLIKEYYGVNTTPAVIVNEHTYQGELVSDTRILLEVIA